MNARKACVLIRPKGDGTGRDGTGVLFPAEQSRLRHAALCAFHPDPHSNGSPRLISPVCMFHMHSNYTGGDGRTESPHLS